MYKVSILIPLYNGIEFIDECLNSIKNQTHKEWEVIIGVNGHDENSGVYKEAKKRENNKIKVLLFSTKGKPNTMNKMINYCSNDIICLLDIDDYWEKTKLEEQLKFIDSYDVVGTQCTYIKNNRPSGQPRIPYGEVIDFISCNPMVSSSLMLRKEDCYWNDVILDDYDLVLRLASENKKFFNIHKPLTLHRLHNQSYFNSKGNHNYFKETVNKWKDLVLNNRN